MSILDDYARVVGEDVIAQLRQLAAPLRGMTLVHVNSTRAGGGVAEILDKMVPLTQELGIHTRWETITGDSDFFECTKGMHNTLQGNRIPLGESLLRVYEETNARNAETLRPVLEEADLVLIHDPQPAALLRHCPGRRGKWIWRCHIDASHPYRPVWKYLRQFVAPYDASIFSLAAFAQELPHPQYLVPPSIDPLSDKNIALPPEAVQQVRDRYGLDPERPLLVQVSRFDRFKDPIGVISAYKLAKRFLPPIQLVLAGGGATDDPEGGAVLGEVQAAAEGDPDVRVLLLPSDAHREINALQQAADIVLQKSVREGFGLTVTEALWKGRPTVAGNVGGIPLQIEDGVSGYLVNSPAECAERCLEILRNPGLGKSLGRAGKEHARREFLSPRLLRDWLRLIGELEA